eukprot:Seg1693.16 transcript_id=Seg1693.16/GoldUCD/mRNA.D3Y31 product="P2Y purinoceptor 6" protein_id=Seg1693.16/GoldUCD/D3Y31
MAFISNGTMSNLVVYNATMNNATLFNRSLYNETIHNGSLITTGASTRSQPIPSKLTAFSVVLVTMYIPFLLVAGIGNLLVILVRVKRFKQSGLSAYKQMICHLSLADIIYATAIPLDIYQRLKGKHWITNSGVCKLLRTTQSASLTASVCILTAMALERFQGISNPLAHHWSTKKLVSVSDFMDSREIELVPGLVKLLNDENKETITSGRGPRCIAFQLRIFHDSIGIRLKNAMHLGKKFFPAIHL